MTVRLRSAAWVAGYSATLGAVVGGLILAPWPTCAVLALAAVAAVVWVVRCVPLGGP